MSVRCADCNRLQAAVRAYLEALDLHTSASFLGMPRLAAEELAETEHALRVLVAQLPKAGP